MIVTKNLKNAKSNEPSILTLGTFDGVHKGHKKIIKQLINESRKNNLRTFILTFFPHPRNVLKSNSEVKSISTLEEKTEIFSKLGVQELIIQDFDKSFSSMTAGEFIELLVNNLNLKKIIVGFNHKFGKNRSADINVLKSYSFKYNFEVIEIKAFEIKDLDPHTVPMNFLNPRPNTPLAHMKPVASLEAIKTIAIFRLIMPEKVLMSGGGREITLRDLQSMGIMAGSNGMIIGNYLTTVGRAPEEDLKMIEDLQMPIRDRYDTIE